MAICRIYLFTYKRNNLLPRAVNSLVNQTFKDWICEVHNDCPEDRFPNALISSLNDERFTVKNHQVNMGAVESFNLAFAGCAEEYVSILEDDNWWEPAFLDEMIGLLQRERGVNVAWSNMHLWKENANGEWTDLNQTIWPAVEEITPFFWPSAGQAMAALHSNSALLYRGAQAQRYIVPESTLLNAVELVRERSFEHPIFLMAKPLANFAITIATNRNDDPYKWIGYQVMMLASFVGCSPDNKKTFQESLNFHRNKKPSAVANFFLANRFLLKDRQLYRYFKFKDWLLILRWLARNSFRLNRFKKCLKSEKDVYSYLLRQTYVRYLENSVPQNVNC